MEEIKPGKNDSIFFTTITIEQKLVDFVNVDGVILVQDVMENLEKFAKNLTFLRIVWKEATNFSRSFSHSGSKRKIIPKKKENLHVLVLGFL